MIGRTVVDTTTLVVDNTNSSETKRQEIKMKTIQVEIKQVYGRDTVYPACESAFIFAGMLNQKTLTSCDIASIKKLGYTITVKQKQL